MTEQHTDGACEPESQYQQEDLPLGLVWVTEPVAPDMAAINTDPPGTWWEHTEDRDA